MGFIFIPELSWTHAKDKMASKTKRAILSLKYLQNPFGYFPSNELPFFLLGHTYEVLNTVKIFNMCVTISTENIYRSIKNYNYSYGF
jgi:hypothetical protein